MNIQPAYRIHSLFVVFVCIIATLLRAQKADYLIVNEPDHLQLLDNYEQRLVDNSLPPYSPMEIVNDDIVLSDDYTHALKVSVASNIFYITKDDNGQLSSSNPELKLKKYQNVTILNDTIKIFNGKELEILFPDTRVNESIFVSGNSQLQRIFKTRSLIYVFVPDQQNKYGWIRTSDKKNWEIVKQVNIYSDEDSSDKAFGQIRLKTEKINLLYSKIFRYMNEKADRTYQSPHWQITEDSKKLLMQFAPQTYQEKFSKSISIFIRELKYLLPNNSYSIAVSNDSSQVEINAQ